MIETIITTSNSGGRILKRLIEYPGLVQPLREQRGIPGLASFDMTEHEIKCVHKQFEITCKCCTADSVSPTRLYACKTELPIDPAKMCV